MSARRPRIMSGIAVSELRRLTEAISATSSLVELGVSECESARRAGRLSDAQFAYLAGRIAAETASNNPEKQRETCAQRHHAHVRNHFRLGWVDAIMSHGASGGGREGRMETMLAKREPTPRPAYRERRVEHSTLS